jgi:hypothetical protein
MGLSNADHIQIKMIDLPIGALAVNTKRLLMPFVETGLRKTSLPLIWTTNVPLPLAASYRSPQMLSVTFS